MKKELLSLGDLKGKSEEQIKIHIATNYGEEYGCKLDLSVMKTLSKMKVLIAYESVGDYGCDSSSFFLFLDEDGTYQTMYGSHCSCFGFEGQFKLEETPVEYLKSEKFNFYCGGYDENEEETQLLVKNI